MGRNTPLLSIEERISIARERLNHGWWRLDLDRHVINNFALDLIDVLDGRIGTLGKDEMARLREWRELP